MKAAKKRYHKKIPEFWNVLKGERKEDWRERMVGMFYCPYIPLSIYEK